MILCWTMLLIPGWWGWVLFGILLVLTGLIGSIRVFTGMHFLRDVFSERESPAFLEFSLICRCFFSVKQKNVRFPA